MQIVEGQVQDDVQRKLEFTVEKTVKVLDTIYDDSQETVAASNNSPFNKLPAKLTLKKQKQSSPTKLTINQDTKIGALKLREYKPFM